MQGWELLGILALLLYGQACLNGPVTKGNVSVSCTVIDNTWTAGDGRGADAPITASYLFQVRITSTDLDVTSVRIDVNRLQPAYDTTPEWKWKRAVTVVKSGSLFSYVFVGSIGYDGDREQPIPLRVAEVTVQELKPSSSQTDGEKRVEQGKAKTWALTGTLPLRPATALH